MLWDEEAQEGGLCQERFDPRTVLHETPPMHESRLAHLTPTLTAPLQPTSMINAEQSSASIIDAELIGNHKRERWLAVE